MSAGTWNGGNAATTTTTFAVSGGTYNMTTGGFTSTTFAITATGQFVATSGTMSTTAVTFSGSGGGSAITATSGTWTLAGSWTQSTTSTTFTHNSGTINITAVSTFNDTRSVFNKIGINTTGNNAVTISANTTAPLGASPTTNNGTATLTVNGTVTCSGAWSHTGSLTVGAAGVVSGALTSFAFTRSLTVTAGGSFTANVALNWTGTVSTQTLDASGITFATSVLNRSASCSIAAGTTLPLGASPVSSTGSGGAAVTVNGALTVSGSWAHTGGVTVGATGTVSGALTALSVTRSFTVNSGGVFPASVPIAFNGDGGGTVNVDAAGITLGTCTINSAGAVTIFANRLHCCAPLVESWLCMQYVQLIYIQHVFYNKIIALEMRKSSLFTKF